MKSHRTRKAGNAEGMEKMNAKKHLVGKPNLEGGRLGVRSVVIL